MHHGDVHAAQAQAVGSLQPEQAGADHHRVFMVGRGGDHRLGVGDVAVGNHAGQVLARHRQDEGGRAGGQQQAVVGHRQIVGDDQALDTVDLGHLLAGMQRDAVVPVPVEVVQHDVGQRHLAGQHGRKQDAVVIAVRLGAEHRDVVEIRGELQQLLHGADAGHAVADDDEFLFVHLKTFHHQDTKFTKGAPRKTRSNTSS